MFITHDKYFETADEILDAHIDGETSKNSMNSELQRLWNDRNKRDPMDSDLYMESEDIGLVERINDYSMIEG